uniref:Uncharacterized protein n=1 Tax=Cacopsylla melanoneura TaxID=428564 RepID=A0A8D8WGF1_9HEMI
MATLTPPSGPYFSNGGHRMIFFLRNTDYNITINASSSPPQRSLSLSLFSPLSLSPPPLISFLPSPFICVSSHNPISPDCFHLIHLSSSGRHYIRGGEGRGRHQILRRKLYGVSMWYGATSLYDEDRLINSRTRAVRMDDTLFPPVELNSLPIYSLRKKLKSNSLRSLSGPQGCNA